MSFVFVSYASVDRRRVARVVRVLHRAGLEVWWDRDLQGGDSFRAEIERNLAAAGAVVVAWTRESVERGGWVPDEADEGRKRGILVPIRLDPVDPPLSFRGTHTLDFTRWNGRGDAPEAEALVAALRSKLALPPLPVPPDRPWGRWLGISLVGAGALGAATWGSRDVEAETRLPVAVLTGDAWATTEEARAEVQSRIEAEAATTCGLIEGVNGGHVLSSRAEALELACEVLGGWRCSGSAVAVCTVQRPRYRW